MKLNKIFLFILAILLVCSGFYIFSQDKAEFVFDVKQEGAKANGTYDDTLIIQKGIDKCAEVGGGTVFLSKGSYLSGPIFLKSKVTLKIEEGATLLGTTDPEVYKGMNYQRATLSLVMGEKDKEISDVTITGGGTIDGQGAIWWQRFKESGNKLERPRLVYIGLCKNLKLENITLTNSPSFHFVPLMCDGVIVNNVKVKAPESSPNTDGIDPSRSKNIKITNCIIDVGDDNIALKADKPRDGKTLTPCENVEITNCTFLNGHGLSIGSETNSGINNLTVKNCTFKGTENGIRIKSSESKGGPIQNLSYSDITMENVLVPITIGFTYVDKNKRDDEKEKKKDWMPSLKNMTITNLKVTGSNNSGVLIGLTDSVLENITLENVEISASVGMVIRHAKNVVFKNVKITPKSGKAVLLTNVEGKGLPNN